MKKYTKQEVENAIQSIIQQMKEKKYEDIDIDKYLK